MKKQIIVLAAAILLTIGNTFANKLNSDIPGRILNEFKKEFVQASNVNWETKATHYKVKFSLDEQNIEAFFSLEGNLLGVTRNMSFNHLPLHLQKDIKEKYVGYWITDLFELSTDNGTEYVITFENADEQISLKGMTMNWDIFKKTDKS
ncbi:MAG: PepSY-like domain-containing protein [Chitinophagaceae bacterium]|jgi:hypothetical protein|nr:PepSY-like domain-containing protein [Chitinophagaceae bacterium]